VTVEDGEHEARQLSGAPECPRKESNLEPSD
jgi:hypothetical protein